MYRPMLAETSPEPFDDPGFLFEVKWDGYRALAEIGRTTRLFGRRQELTALFPELRDLGGGVRSPVILDGEIVAFSETGFPSFAALRRAPRTLAYVAFDLLEEDGRPLLEEPLVIRRQALQAFCDRVDNRRLLLSRGRVGEGRFFFQAIQDLALEGMMAKALSSPYRPGQRSSAWKKVLNGCETVVQIPLIEETPAHGWVAWVVEEGVARGRLLLPAPRIPTSFLEGVRVRREGGRFRLDPPLRAEVRYRQLTPEGRFRHGRFQRFLRP